MTTSLVNLYRFKDITVVPAAKDLVDVVLSRTQRKTPTEVHKQFKITRIRSFYMRKVKFCQQTIHDKLTDILTQFPKLDDIHPFYSDLCNVLYDRDHYKLALGQCNAVRGIVDSIAKDYVRLMKYADSLYKCKMLKRAALGRMCTALRKLQQSFAYLEEVRQHLARLPSINPHTRTLILAGYPNVGKSSFINAVSHANVEIQPYAFTTKSLFVGHFDYSYTRWQVIDTPGILDRPLEDRNTVEMTAITALAHIQAAVLYIVDLSELCGFTLESQVKLFHSIKPLFKNKALLVVLNKCDVKPLDSLTVDEKKLLESMKDGGSEFPVEFVVTSTLTLQGIDTAKNRACDLLLESRVTKKAGGAGVGRVESIMNRLFVTEPTVTAKSSNRLPCIPQSVIEARRQAADKQIEKADGSLADAEEADDEEERMEVESERKRRTERDLQEEEGGAGVYSVDLRKQYELADPMWKYDVIPEIFGGKNIADFIDPDIEAKLEELEKEEEELLEEDAKINYHDPEWIETQKLLKELHSRMELTRLNNRLKRAGNTAPMPRPKLVRKVRDAVKHLGQLGYETDGVKQRAIANSKCPSRKHSLSTALRARTSITNHDTDPTTSSTTANSTSASTTTTTVAGTQLTRRQTKLAVREERLMQREQLGRKGWRQPRTKGVGKLPSSLDGLPTKGLGKGVGMGKMTAGNRVSMGLSRVKDRVKGEKLKRSAEKQRNMKGMKGEGDRFIGNKMPKHLFSGKRGIGKTAWR
eukprot:GHVQ01029977.1.p1 GENE.GHVQ01029977.1~~GHVQ01029977.1.p1  ORF type:complete len:753 (+),score=118.63 GHVQ01029977.1:240-2498(+)